MEVIEDLNTITARINELDAQASELMAEQAELLDSEEGWTVESAELEVKIWEAEGMRAALAAELFKAKRSTMESMSEELSEALDEAERLANENVQLYWKCIVLAGDALADVQDEESDGERLKECVAEIAQRQQQSDDNDAEMVAHDHVINEHLNAAIANAGTGHEEEEEEEEA